jgi:5-methylcytosine-specific restriction enzyme A
MRTVPEWIGETPETAVPLRVKLRVFDAHGGRCHWSGKKIAAGDRWDVDHVRALINGGENRESNLAPILREKHREKTALDIDEKSKVARVRAKHLGLWPKSRFQIQPKVDLQWARRNERRAFCRELGDANLIEQGQLTTNFTERSSYSTRRSRNY